MNVSTKKSGVKQSIFHGALLVSLVLCFASGCAFRATFEGGAGANAKIQHQEEKSKIGGGSVREFHKRSAQQN